MGVGVVLVSNLVKEVNLVTVEESGSRDAVHRRVSPALIVEPTELLEVVEERGVRGSAPEIHVGDFKV